MPVMLGFFGTRPTPSGSKLPHSKAPFFHAGMTFLVIDSEAAITERQNKIIDHIGMAVRSLADARRFFEEGLGIPRSVTEEVPTQKVRVEFYQIGGTRIECLEPTSEDSPIAKFLDKKGEGIHHIAIRVPSIREMLDKAREHGIQAIDQEPRPGVEGTMIAFLHPKSTHGVLIELMEFGDKN
jgi:methylmalonyl-CoA/ethylmalonyl-CoA epimerase